MGKKKINLENLIKVNQKIINSPNEQLTSAMSRGLRLKDSISKDAMMKTVQSIQKVVMETSAENQELQNKLLNHISKKPKE